MKLGKTLVAALVAPALVTPAIAAEAVRPGVKPVAAAAKQNRSVVIRTQRAGAKLENEKQMLIGFPLLLLAVGAAVAVVAVVAVTDKGSSPG